MGEYADEAVERAIWGRFEDSFWHNAFGPPRPREPVWVNPDPVTRDNDGNPYVYCSKCSIHAICVNGKAVYGRVDLADKMFWVCTICRDRVGCHPHTNEPLGYLAGPALRAARSKAHACFDPIWRNGHMTRGTAYAKMCVWLQMDPAYCHMGMMDEPMLARVVDFVRAHFPAYAPKPLDNIANFKF